MRRVLIVVTLVVAAAVLGLWRSHGGIRRNLSQAVGTPSDEQQGEARDEIRKSFELQRGATVEVRGINGLVEINTFETGGTQDSRAPKTKAAEVYVLRTANSRDALSRREVVIEQTANGLLVHGQQARGLSFWERLWGHNPNERVTINAPRQIALSLKGINGRVTSGDVDGPLEVKGINGRVELGQASESIEIGGINGNISVGFKQLGERGARLSGINGNIELRLANNLNADLTAKGMNGRVRSDIPEVTVDKEEYSSRYSARIGSGGAPIAISGINGNVRLTRTESAAASSNQKEMKSAAETKSGKSEK